MKEYRLKEGSVQLAFSKSRAPIQIFGGGWGNGKTTAAIIKVLQLVRDYPGSEGLIARATYPKLKDTIQKFFFQWCPPNWIKRRPTKDDNTCYFKNGSVINFRYIAQRGKSSETGDTTSNLLSASYDYAVVDQIEDPEITQKDFEDLLGRLRGVTPYRPPAGAEDPTMPHLGPDWLIINCNPTHNWVFKRLVQPILTFKNQGLVTPNLIVHPRTHEPMIELFEGPTHDNSDNLPEGYIDGLEATLTGQRKRRYLGGEWAAYEGLVYGEYNENRHTAPRDEILAYLSALLARNVRVYAWEAYDFGIVSPSVYLFGFVDDVGRVFVIDGYYAPSFDIFEQPDKIKSIRLDYPQVLVKHPVRADPAIFKRTIVAGYKATAKTVARILHEGGVKSIPGSNDIKQGVAKVSSYMSVDNKLPDPLRDFDQGPLFFWARELSYITDEITNYFWDKNNLGDYVDKPIDRNDHAMDAIKYGLSFLPNPSDLIKLANPAQPAWRQWHEIDDNGRSRPLL